MIRYIRILLVVSMVYTPLKCSKQTIVTVLRPSTPKMCRELCQSSTSSFNFFKEDHSCRLIIKNDSVTDENRLHVKEKTMTGTSPVTVIRKVHRFEKMSKGYQDLRATTAYPDNLDSYIHNISLYKACEKGKLDAVKYILSRGLEDTNCRGHLGRTPVMAAIYHGQARVFNYLYNHMIDLDLSVIDDQKNNVLHVACMGGNIDIVRKLINSGIYDIDGKGRYGRTPLMFAVREGHKEIFDLLESRNCILAAVDTFKYNILHVACIGGHVKMVRLILSRNQFDIESKGFRAMTPVLTAASYGHKRVVDLLEIKGCNMKAVNEDNNSILHVVCSRVNVEMVKHILRKNIVTIESPGQVGRTPLMIAALCGRKRVFDLLARKGSNTTAVDNDKNNILHVACVGGHVDMVKHILTNYIVGIESPGQEGRTPLMTAALCGRKKVFDLLARKGSNMTAVDNDKNNILHVACVGGHVEMVKYILTNYIDGIESPGQEGRTPLMTAALCGRKGVFDLLARKGSNMTAVDDDKNNILHVACVGGHVEMVKYILTRNIVGIESPGQEGRTPLMTAALCGRKKVFDLLARKGSNMTAVDSDKNNILHVACVGGHVDMVKYILTKNIVGIESPGQEDRTPLMIAALCGRKRVFDLLVRKGSNMTAVDDDKNNILHMACIGGHVDMVKHLLRMSFVKGMWKVKNRYGRTPAQEAERRRHGSIVRLLKK